MALLIAPLFTAGIALGGIQNANAGGQDWTVTLTNGHRTFTWTHGEDGGDCDFKSSLHCDLPFSEGKLRKCINSSEAGGIQTITFVNVNNSEKTVFCNGPWELTMVATGLPSADAFIHF